MAKKGKKGRSPGAGLAGASSPGDAAGESEEAAEVTAVPSSASASNGAERLPGQTPADDDEPGAAVLAADSEDAQDDAQASATRGPASVQGRNGSQAAAEKSAEQQGGTEMQGAAAAVTRDRGGWDAETGCRQEPNAAAVATEEEEEEGRAATPRAPDIINRSYSGLDEDFMAELQANAPGFRPSFGGEELRRAFAALGGTALLTPHTPHEETLAQVPGEGGGEAAGGASAAGSSGSSRGARGPAAAAAAQPPRAKVPLPPLPVREVEDARSRELMFAAKRYCAALISNPSDFHAAYNHGLVLQELAGIRGRRPADQEKLLLEAVESYGAALQICPSAHAVLYNWGVALTDLARLAKMSGSPSHRGLLNAAGEKYAAALRCNPRNPQALNNLGLVLQDLAQGLPPERHRELMGWAAAKFRRALRQRPDFHRAAYNLGTAYYANAAALGHHQWPSAHDGPSQAMDPLVQSLFQRAAQYVCLAFALEPFKEVYRRSLAVVRAQLPLPFLRSGYLLAVRPDTAGKASETWVRNWFVLNEAFLMEVEAPKIEEHHALKKDALLSSLSKGLAAPAGTPKHNGSRDAAPPVSPHDGGGEDRAMIRIRLHDVSHVQRSYDPSLPTGGGLWLQLRGGPAQGLYLVADNGEDADCWADALLLGAFLVEQRREEALAKALRSSSGWDDAEAPEGIIGIMGI